MSHTPHELNEEFPTSVEVMRWLEQTNQHFARISEKYHAINRQIHRIETNLEPASDFHANSLRRQRLHLKDEVARMIKGKMPAFEACAA